MKTLVLIAAPVTLLAWLHWTSDSSPLAPSAHAESQSSTCKQWEITHWSARLDETCSSSTSIQLPRHSQEEVCTLPKGWEPFAWNDLGGVMLRRCVHASH